jgi:hypothetical protein
VLSLPAMLQDLMTAFLVALAAVTASGLLSSNMGVLLRAGRLAGRSYERIAPAGRPISFRAFLEYHPVMPRDPLGDANPPESEWRHWAQWGLAILAIAIIVLIVLVGTDVRKPWVLALF